jgi:hypothetical protein
MTSVETARANETRKGAEMVMNKFSAVAGAAAMMLLAGAGTAVNAQCPDGTSNCANQVIPQDLMNEYQAVGEMSRVDGQGPRMKNKLENVLLYDNSPTHNAGRQAVRRKMVRTANRYGFELTINDGAIGWINAERLDGVDVVVFSQNDRDVLGGLTTASTTAMENFIYREGKSMVMVHAASAFIVCPGVGTGGGGANIHDPSCRFLARATVRQYFQHQAPNTPMRVYADSTLPGQLPPHGSLGAPNNTGPVPPPAVIPHGRMNPETANIFNNDLEFNWTLPPNSPTDPRTYVWDEVGDEWYNYSSSPRTIDTTMIRNVTNFDPPERHIEGKVNILLSLDEMSRNIGGQRMGDHPMSWTRRMGNGLAAYVNTGHDNAPFTARTGDGRTGNDSVATKYFWNLLRYLARDYEGCRDPDYAEYNPDASVENITGYEDPKPEVPPVTDPCITPLPGISISSGSGAGNSIQGITALPSGIQIETPDAGRRHLAS